MFEGSVIVNILAFVLSFVFALLWTPIMRKAALQLGVVDRPDGNLKTHTESTPYLGGIAVFTAFLLTVGVLTDFSQETLGLLLSGSIALMVGLIDDFGVMTPIQKLLGQMLAALVLVKSGTFIKLQFLNLINQSSLISIFYHLTLDLLQFTHKHPLYLFYRFSFLFFMYQTPLKDISNELDILLCLSI